MSTHVEILLSTFNGARFLPAQLSSLQTQSHADWRLLWRDDGSNDDTCQIMDAFIQSEPRARALADGQPRMGVTRSFETLLHARDPSAGAIAFCDQDDVWLPEKLAQGLNALAGQTSPALICGRLHLVDEQLNPIGLSPAPNRPARLGDLLVENRATGCTIIMNVPAAALLDRPWPSGVVMHDWWACLCVAAAGGRIEYLSEPQILYRQHGGNVVGIAGNSFARWRNRWRRFAKRQGRPLTEQALALQRYTQGLISENQNRVIADFVNGGWPLTFDLRYRRQHIADDIIFRVMRLFNLV